MTTDPDAPDTTDDTAVTFRRAGAIIATRVAAALSPEDRERLSLILDDGGRIEVVAHIPSGRIMVAAFTAGGELALTAELADVAPVRAMN